MTSVVYYPEKKEQSTLTPKSSCMSPLKMEKSSCYLWDKSKISNVSLDLQTGMRMWKSIPHEPASLTWKQGKWYKQEELWSHEVGVGINEILQSIMMIMWKEGKRYGNCMLTSWYMNWGILRMQVRKCAMSLTCCWSKERCEETAFTECATSLTPCWW